MVLRVSVDTYKLKFHSIIIWVYNINVGSIPTLATIKPFSRIFTTKYHIIRVSYDYDDWRRILIAQDDEYLRCILSVLADVQGSVLTVQSCISNLQYGWNGFKNIKSLTISLFLYNAEVRVLHLLLFW